MSLHLCQTGYEKFLVKELSGPAESLGPGWVMGPDSKSESCFSHLSLISPAELSGGSVNALAGSIADFFTNSVKDVRFVDPWPLCFDGVSEPGLSRRLKVVEEEVFARVKSRIARVAKLAVPGRPGPGPASGLFVFFSGFDKVLVSRSAVAGGQRRMADDPQAPSRSYLKVEEAYGVLGRAPAAGETVVDLGAAPGGWSYSAAKHGASVIAVDNGPLKGGAIHERIIHKAEDAFKYARGKPVDWLFCDMVEDPERIAALLGQWLQRGWCRNFVVNLKFGRADPLKVLDDARALSPRCALLRARHLYHDREELTVVGSVK